MTAGDGLLRWGVLGTAGINDRVLPAMSRSRLGRVDAIASRTTAKAVEVAGRMGIPRAYGSYEDLLAAPDIDAVYLPLPNFLHLEWVLAAAAAGKHILCEKPMAITADDARKMVDAARSGGVFLAEAFMYGHHPRYDRLHEIVGSGEIGDVRGITGTFTFDASDEPDLTGFRGHPGSGAVYDVGCYVVHAARRMLGTEPVAVTATAQVSDAHGGADMMTSALIEFPEDIGLLMQCGMWAADEDSLRILGSRGRIEVPSAFFCEEGREGFTVWVDGLSRVEHVAGIDHYTAQADHFAEVVLSGAAWTYPLEDPVAGAAALEACVQSIRSKTRVALNGH